MNCSYCGNTVTETTGETIYPQRDDLKHLKFLHCVQCDAYCRIIKGKPYGTMADAELRSARSATHRVFDILWKSRNISRTRAYFWLAEAMELPIQDCHIRLFTLEQCLKATELAREKLKARGLSHLRMLQ